MLDLVTFGEVMGVLLAHPTVPLRQATEFTRDIAGAEANVAVALSRLDHQVGWVGAVGQDAFGYDALDRLRANGVDVSRARSDSRAPTGLIVRDAHPVRQISVAYHRAGSAASLVGPDDLDLEYLVDARRLHLTGITPALSDSCRDATYAVVEAARSAGTPISFDPNIRLRLWSAEEAVAALRPLVAYADIVLTSAEEARLLTGRDDADDAARELLELGSSLVVVKDGSAGAWATDGQETWRVGAFPAQVVDPVGAGDAFDAGFLSGVLDGCGVEDSLRRGAAVGALCVQSLGDLPGLPYRADLEAVLAGSDTDR